MSANLPPLRLRYMGEGEFKAVSNYFVAKSDEVAVVGEIYTLVEQEEDRSDKAHRFFFAAVKKGFENVPHDMHSLYPSVEHLRKRALICCGYSHEKVFRQSSSTLAQAFAAGYRTSDIVAIVDVEDNLVRIREAQSISKRAMDAKSFYRMSELVLAFISRLIRVDVTELLKATERDPD